MLNLFHGDVSRMMICLNSQ